MIALELVDTFVGSILSYDCQVGVYQV